MTGAPTSIAGAKAQAKALRAEREAQGTVIGHGQSLERIAVRHGYRDWNTLRAALANRPFVPVAVRDRVRGRYLSRPFEAEVIAVEKVRPGWFRVTLEFDAPVDVVTSEAFSNFRKRVTGVVGPKGMSREKTSDGQPQLLLI